MLGSEIYEILHDRGISTLHHANTVTTSCTFLETGGLASRKYVEDRYLAQTPQSSDSADKQFQVWDRIFVDHVDIHHRGGKSRGPNYYGPVLFLLKLEVLLTLPEGTDVLVAKRNPIYWPNLPASERWFTDKDQLAQEFVVGEFEKMLMIQTPAGILSFPDELIQINLDNPNRKLSTGEDSHSHSLARLNASAELGGVEIAINPANCKIGCRCAEEYLGYSTTQIDRLFK